MDLTRGAGSDVMGAISSPVFYPIAMLYLDWPGNELRVHSGVKDISWGGHTWRGVSKLGRISVPVEQTGIAATVATLTLLGIPPGSLDELNDPIRNRPGVLYLGLTTTLGGDALIGAPVHLFAGYMDALRVTAEDEDGNLRHSLQVDLGTGPGARSRASVTHSAEDQSFAYPGDTAGRHLIFNRANQEAMTWPES